MSATITVFASRVAHSDPDDLYIEYLETIPMTSYVYYKLAAESSKWSEISSPLLVLNSTTPMRDCQRPTSRRKPNENLMKVFSLLRTLRLGGYNDKMKI